MLALHLRRQIVYGKVGGGDVVGQARTAADGPLAAPRGIVREAEARREVINVGLGRAEEKAPGRIVGNGVARLKVFVPWNPVVLVAQAEVQC